MAEQGPSSTTSDETMEIASTENEMYTETEQEMQDRNNFAMFRDGITQCIDKCFDAKVFAKCYKPLWEKNRDVFEPLIQRVMSQAKDKVKEELEKAFKNEDIAGSLSLMDELLKESNKTESEKVSWRPTGDPEADSRAYFMALKKRKLQELETELQKTKNQERLLCESVREKQEKLFATESNIKAVLERAKNGADDLQKFELENSLYINSFNEKVQQQNFEKETHFGEPDVTMET